jgi:hypothetical protein
MATTFAANPQNNEIMPTTDGGVKPQIDDDIDLDQWETDGGSVGLFIRR